MKKTLWMVVLMGAAMGGVGCSYNGQDVIQPTAKDVAPMAKGGDTKPSRGLEFRIAPLNPQSFRGTDAQPSEADIQRYVKSLKTEGPDALIDDGAPYAWFPIRGKEGNYDSMITQDHAGRRYLLLSNKAEQRMVQDMGKRKWGLASARVGRDQTGSPAIDFEFDNAGASYFSRLTKSNIGQQLAILLNDEVYSAPQIRSMICSRGQITGKFTDKEAQDLVRSLK